jgi:hypothetical protein
VELKILPTPAPRAAKTAVVRYGRASRTRLNGVWVARRTRVKPAASRTSRNRASPAWPPSASPTSWDLELGVHTIVEAA